MNLLCKLAHIITTKKVFRTIITFYYSGKHLVQILNIILSSTEFNKPYERVYFDKVFTDIHIYCHQQNTMAYLVLTNKSFFLIFYSMSEKEIINNKQSLFCYVFIHKTSNKSQFYSNNDNRYSIPYHL